MGRHKGRASRPNSGSWNDFLNSMKVGQVYWHETTRERAFNECSIINTPPSRRPESMQGMVFTTAIFTAVPCGLGNEVTYLIKLERIE